MKILLSNKFYYPRGGDCIYTLNLEELLKKHGHEVAVFAMQHPDTLASPYEKYFPSEVKFSPGLRIIEAFCRPFGTNEVKKKFNALLNDFQPDVVHLNNIHSQLSPVIAQIAHERKIKVVWTLHDYKLLCPRYDCRRNDKEICERCFTDKKHVLKNKCMKNSLLASIIAYKESKKWTRERLETYVNTFICPSRFLADKIVQGGFSQSKITVLCNFIDTDKTKRSHYDKENYYCYVGRLSQEKGVKTLLEAAAQLPYHLKIIGGGPLAAELRQSVTHENIEFSGYKNWDEIKLLVGNARFSVIPSEWYENNPLSVIEAQCLGTPVLGANIGGIPELIEEGKSGLLFESGNANDLKDKIKQMFTREFDYKTLAENAQIMYSAENYYQEIMKIYDL
ncbi:MAG: glycosyltransferase family 4 protein [Planctomycetaceae bacterium]|jgi:glycosyltransferase involved in cell wall biosynthesis|nr:glycosyltransferase family 4 protein [Planctomycetaceae bacterium]